MFFSLSPRQGAQGTYDEASNAEKENEFGTKVDDEVIEKILASGTLQESSVSQQRPPPPPASSLIRGDDEKFLTECLSSSPSAKAPRTTLRAPSLPTRGENYKKGAAPTCVRQESFSDMVGASGDSGGACPYVYYEVMPAVFFFLPDGRTRFPI